MCDLTKGMPEFIFLSTSSARRTTALIATSPRPMHISIHVLREEDDGFYVLAAHAFFEFLSTSSARRTTEQGNEASDTGRISIHVLREEDDSGQCSPCFRAHMISIHVLREEDDVRPACSGGMLGHFYPRPPRGGRLPLPNPGHQFRYFYPRPPRGGRPSCALLPRSICAISIHVLREEDDEEYWSM